MAGLEEPKKPMTSYFIYVQAEREGVQKELGVKDFGPVTKALSARWKILAKPELAKYEKQAADLKAQYEKDLAAFEKAGGVKGAKRKEKKDEKKAKASKKAKKSSDTASGKPKKPCGGGYGCFIAQNRGELMKSLPAGSACTAVSKVAGERWKAMSATDKEKYEAEYKAKKATYDTELKAWTEKNGDGKDDDDEDEEEDEAVAGGA